MKKLSKALVLLLSVALICTGIIFVASADEAKAETASYVAGGETLEGSLADAIAAADAGTTVTLLGDSTISAEIAVTKNVTVDLNGYKLTTECASAFNVTNGEAVFNITGTGNITSAGTLVKATADGAKIAITGTGLDGIEVTHTGAQAISFIALQTNTLSITNARIYSSKGAKSSFFIDNTGNSNITISKTAINLDFNNVNGWHATAYYFANIGGTSHITIENSSVYMRNNLIQMHNANNGTNESVLIKNSTISTNDTGTTKGQRLAIIFAGGSTTANGTVNIYDSNLECSGRMFASEVNTTDIYVNAYGVTFKTFRSESELSGNSPSFLTRNIAALNLFNSESGKACKIIAIHAELNQNDPNNLYAYEPGLRVNLKATTTGADEKTGIKVPVAFDSEGNVTEWTYSASSEKYGWVYDPLGDPEAPYVLVDKTAEAIDTPDWAYSWSFDSVIFNKITKDKTIRKEYQTSSIIDAENILGTMHIGSFRGSILSGYETGNAYLKYVVTPYDTSMGVALADIYGDTYDGSYRNFNKEKEKDNTTRTTELTTNSNAGKSDPFFDVGCTDFKNGNYVNTGYSTRKVVVVDFDFGSDSDKGFPALTMVTQSRSETGGNLNDNNKGDTAKRLNISNKGIITNSLDNQPSDAYTQLNINEWYHFSVVYYTEANIAYIYINGQLMGTSPAYFDTADFDENSYVQGYRINVNNGSDHVVDSSFALDNASIVAYSNYKYEETSETLSAATAINYAKTASPRKYMRDALTVLGMPMNSLSEAVNVANKLNTKIDVNSNINLYDVKENVTVDFGGNNVTVGEGSYGFVKNGEKYTFNENYWYNAYKFTGDLANLTSGSYSDSDFTSVGVIKLGFELDIENYYTERTPNYNNYTVNTQNGWVYAYGDTDSVLPKVPDLSDLENADENKNVYYLPLLEAVNMTYYVKNSSGEVTSYGIGAEETLAALKALTGVCTFVLNEDVDITSSGTNYLRYINSAATTTEAEVKTVNGVTIDNDYTEEEIAAMRQAASDIKIDLNGNTLTMAKTLVIVSRNVELSIFSSKAGAEVNMMYVKNSAVTAERTFKLACAYESGSGATVAETEAGMLDNYNCRMNFGTYTDRNGNVVSSEHIAFTGSNIYDIVSGDSSCEVNIKNVTATRAADVTIGLIASRYYDGRINVSDSVLVNIATTGSKIVSVSTPSTLGEVVYSPEIVFENCILLGKTSTQSVVNSGGLKDETNSKNIVFKNCVSNGRINPAENNHVYFGEGTTGAFMAPVMYDTEGLVDAYIWEPMNLGSFADADANFKKIRVPVYDSANKTVNNENYVYFVNNGYGEEFNAANPGASYYELPVLTTKIVKEEDAVKVTFNKLDGTAATEVYYVKGADVQARTSNTSNGFNTVALTGDNATYTANALILTYTGWETLPTDVQADVVVNPIYTAKANIEGLKANLSLYADFNVNLYMPVKYADYAAIYFGENLINTTSATIDDAEYLAATVSQKCNMAGDDIVFTVAVSETINGKLCEAEASVTLSITKYASAILEGDYTDANKVLMYYMLNYANEAEKYIDNASDEKVTALLDTYSAYGEKYNVDYTYNELCDTASLTDVFEEATLDIESSPAFLFTLKDGFAGTVTITYANGINTRNYEVSAESDRTIALENMKVYNFGTILTITAEGEINGEAVSVSGKYSLDTFADYHANNAVNDASETKEASVACLPLIKSLFAYAEVAELHKTNTLADALVVTE